MTYGRVGHRNFPLFPGLSRPVVSHLPPHRPPSFPYGTSGRDDEEIRLGRRELYVLYPGGMGRSKLNLPAARDGTARNMNTVAKLAEMAADI